MTKDEALKLALEALEGLFGTAEQFEGGGVAVWRLGGSAQPKQAITAIKEALAQPAQEPVAYSYTSRITGAVGWKLVPIEPTNEMLKAMDECSTEGYDERLLAGHASSVYMAAVDVAPTPPQRTWFGLTDEEIIRICSHLGFAQLSPIEVARAIESALRKKNNA